MFTETVEQQDLARQDPEYIDLLRRVLAIQADCEDIHSVIMAGDVTTWLGG